VLQYIFGVLETNIDFEATAQSHNRRISYISQKYLRIAGGQLKVLRAKSFQFYSLRWNQKHDS